MNILHRDFTFDHTPVHTRTGTGPDAYKYERCSLREIEIMRSVLFFIAGILVSSALAQKPVDATAHHPDGTPIFPEELRSVLREAILAGKEVAWPGVKDLAMGDDLEAFTDAMQKHFYDTMFARDGSAYDVAEWRKMYREDAFYSGLMQQNAPDYHKMIMTGTDEEVQEMFRQSQEAAVRAAAREKSEL